MQAAQAKTRGHHHRRNLDGVMCEVVKFTDTCTGCKCDIMERDNKGIPLGMGCGECGYTGKRRHVYYIPLNECC